MRLEASGLDDAQPHFFEQRVDPRLRSRRGEGDASVTALLAPVWRRSELSADWRCAELEGKEVLRA